MFLPVMAVLHGKLLEFVTGNASAYCFVEVEL